MDFGSWATVVLLWMCEILIVGLWGLEVEDGDADRRDRGVEQWRYGGVRACLDGI